MSLEKIKQQLKKNGYNQVELVYTFRMSVEGYECPIDLEMSLVTKIIEKVSVPPTTKGTGHAWPVLRLCSVPMQGFGIGNANSRDHGATKM